MGPSPTTFESAGDRLGDGRRIWTGAPLPPLPVIATALAGEWGESGSQIELTESRPSETLECVARPASLAGDGQAFALTVVGDSMWPRFRPGRLIAISPRSPVAVGDDALVRLRSDSAGGSAGTDLVLIKQLVKRTAAKVELRQYNPEGTFSVDTDQIDSIVKVLGQLV